MGKIGFWREILAGIVAMMGLGMPAEASYTGLLVTSGGNLYEITASGGLTLVYGNVGISVGAITQWTPHGTNQSKFFALNSSGTDLYLITLNLSQSNTITHQGSLGYTGYGLVYVGGTLYTLVHNASTSKYDLYTLSTSTGSATLKASGLISDSYGPSLTTDGTYLYVSQASSGDVNRFTTGGSYIDFELVEHDGFTSAVNAASMAYDGSKIWILDNVANELSDHSYVANAIAYVNVDATGVYTYNGMCWGYVPF